MRYKKKDTSDNIFSATGLKDFNLLEAAGKEACNRQLFTVVAPVYHLITRLLSFNRDNAWKKKLVRLLPASAPHRILDLACGSGDLTRLLARRYPHARLWGVDLNPAMLALARRRFKHLKKEKKQNRSQSLRFLPEDERIKFLEESMLALSAPDAYFDLVTGGYALRNAPDLAKALLEVKRVLKNGGTAAFLDFSKPVFKPLQRAQLCLLRWWGRLWGWIFHRNPDVYGYIAASLNLFPDRRSLRQLLNALGFKKIRTHLLFGGFTALTFFEK